MSLVYFMSESGDLICLDGTEAVDVSRSNSVSKSSMMSGRSVADGVAEGNKIITVTGICTYTKSVRQQQNGNPDPLKLQDLLDEVVRNQEKFKLRFKKGAYTLLRDIKNCVIVDQSVRVADYLDSVAVTLTIEEVFVSESAKKTYLQAIPSRAAEPQIAGVTDSRGTKAALTVEQRKQAVTNKELQANIKRG